LIPAKYSYNWSMGIVKKLRDKHVRATDTMMEILGITAVDLAHFLAIGDSVFVDLRNLVHWLESCGDFRENNYTSDELIRRIHLYWRCKSRDRLMNRLDEVQKRARLREQGSRGGG
jgi:hypothetical protein